MMYNVVISERAENHLNEAIDWYEQKSAGLGKILLISFKNCIKLLISNPFDFTKVYNEIRKINTHKCPYSIYYLIDEKSDEVLVFAVLHSHLYPNLYKKIADNE